MLSQDQIDIGAMARGVIETLDSLESYLTSAMNPNRRALSDLGLKAMGWTEQAYSDLAFEIWQKQHHLDPNDPLTIHHMAIMHHARAFDLEASENASAADEDWKQAMTLWHRLYESNAFWENLAAKACSGATNTSGVNELRTVFPQIILAVHYDIALDDATRAKRKSRTKFHIALAQNSPFDAESRSKARIAAYEKFIQVIPDHVLKPDELREEEVAKGTKVIEAYLLYDPGCQQALERALQLQKRMQRARNIRWRSLDEKDSERTRILEREKKDYEHWHPYFKQLVAMRDELQDYERENLATWYFIAGDSISAYDREEDAIACFETAIVVSADEDDRKKYQQRLVRTLAYVARTKAEEKNSSAGVYCEKIRARTDLTVVACLLLAQAYLTMFDAVPEDDLSLLDSASELCQRGLGIDPDFDDLEADDHKEHLRSFVGFIGKRRVASELRKLLLQARTAMEAERHNEALGLLDQAERLAKAEDLLESNNSIYWLRTQAYTASGRIPEAKRDLELYRATLTPSSSASDVKACQKLEKLITDAEASVREFGGSEAQNLRQRAISAFNADKHVEAIELLRLALEESKKRGYPGGAPKLKAELSLVLTMAAISMTNLAQEKFMATRWRTTI